MATQSPATAEQVKREALSIFPTSEKISGVVIDNCGHLKPGTGGKGTQYYCSDVMALSSNQQRDLSSQRNSTGPVLVVVPNGSSEAVAITKYEITESQLWRYCQLSGQCENPIGAEGSNLPITNTPISVAERYAEWLSSTTGFTYRLPTHKEWFTAANARRESEDPNRNCQLKFGALSLGESILAVDVGNPNSFGLTHHVGNVREWVYDEGRLLAVGGAHTDPMRRCTLETKISHSGSADAITGFRLVRELYRR
ncbi:MAG: formylglycine-generating enzyme family protein [Cellvibrionaceae bacterium]